MRGLSKVMCLVSLLAVALPAAAQEESISAPMATPVGHGLPLATTSDRPLTLILDEHGFPPPGPPISLFSPFEVFARTGGSFSTESGPLDKGLRTIGVAVEGGVRSFLYNSNHSAAWTAEVGLEYLYNNVRGGDVFLTRGGYLTVFRFQQPTPLLSFSEYTFRQLHRTSARLALGREWYFFADDGDGWRGSFGVDAGGRWGRAQVKMMAVRREIDGLQFFDIIPGLRDGTTGDVLKGVFVAGHSNWLIPRNGYDLVLGGRVEWGKDFFVIADRDDGVAQLKLMLTLGFRF